MNRNLKSALRTLMPRTIRDHRIWQGPLRGLHIVTSWYDYPAAILGYTERLLLEWFARNAAAGETWLDIGAHYGYTSLALARLVGAKGRVFAFEPMLSTVGHLVRTRLLNGFSQIAVLPMALGNPQELEIGKLPTVRGMIDSTLGAGEWNETLVIARLDWLWPQIAGEQQAIHGVKIDVQGMELKVLQGMTSILKTFRPKVVVEFYYGVVREDLLALLEAAGYSVPGVPIDPIEGEDEPEYIDDRSYAFQAAGISAESSRVVGGEQIRA